MLPASANAVHHISSSTVLLSSLPSSHYRITTPLIVATFLAFLVALGLGIIYIPSTTSTTLQLRSGVIPTFRDANFFDMRVAPDVTTLLTGGLFWGCIYASIVFGSVIGFVVFLFLWQVTRLYMLNLLAVIIGEKYTLIACDFSLVLQCLFFITPCWLFL